MSTGAPTSALCCTCGTARSLRYRRDGSYSPPGYDYRDGTCTLKCQGCGQRTRHAIVQSDEDLAIRDRARKRWAELRGSPPEWEQE